MTIISKITMVHHIYIFNGIDICIYVNEWNDALNDIIPYSSTIFDLGSILYTPTCVCVCITYSVYMALYLIDI